MMQFDKRDSIRVERMLEVLKQTETAVERGRPCDRELARVFRQNRRFGSHDRRLYSAAAFALFRWRGWTGTLAANGPSAVLQALLLDAVEITPQLAALADSIGISQKNLRPLGNLDLIAKSESLSDKPSYKALVPEWAWDALPFQSEEQELAWAESIQTQLPVWLRIAPGHAETSTRFLAANGIETRPHPHLPNSFATEHNISRAILNAKEAANIHIQDLASQLVGQVCAPKQNESWWDVCAGAGGKTFHLADLMENKGNVLATDIRSETLRNLHQRLRRSELGTIRTEKLETSASLPSSAPFDGVLLDAPCSGTGTWARNPDARWRTNPQFVKKCAARQLKLISNAATAVKQGGTLVYAVCSPLEAETVAVVNIFLAEHPEFQLASFENPLNGSPDNGTCLVDAHAERTIDMFIAKFRA